VCVSYIPRKGIQCEPASVWYGTWKFVNLSKTMLVNKTKAVEGHSRSYFIVLGG